jgi:hypothetical protein
MLPYELWIPLSEGRQINDAEGHNEEFEQI